MGWRSRYRGQIFWRAAFLGSVAVLWSASLPPFDVVFVLGALTCGLTLLAGCGVAWIVAGIHSVRAGTLTTHRLWWFPLTAALLTVLLGSGAPIHARWAYAEPKFEAAIAALPDMDGYISDDGKPQSVAGYEIRGVEKQGDIVLFWISEPWLFTRGGIGYFPGGPDPAKLHHLHLLELPTFTHSSGDWYIFTEAAFFPFD